ncbi:translational machinery protein [Ancylobacter amanitiformis]|uniref:Stalled ribosome rescue protein Dom34 n=1 Tax=Ancylobacter amanitiformis TaxID=217069 RepID=A0ABU0LTI0_9HYPH|nr:translational machinery protein [Ancylobacter amanitiformis]MDQ0511996.1 stalled ribosome rescue protein Dom34 [Ancylobacter amanitiformis]
MTSPYHAVIWIDHHEARIFHFDSTSAERVVIHPEHPVKHVHHKANAVGDGRSAEDQAFFHHVATAIADAKAVLVTGPGNEKDLFVKHVEHHDPKLKALIAAVKTVDHPTDNELVALARAAFHADHQSPQRSA